MRSEFLGKTVLITGASSGIGREFARQMHEAGAKLLLVARRKDRLAELCRELNALRPESAQALVADLASDATQGDVLGLGDLVARLSSESIDILVNNAGLGSFGEFEQLPIEGDLDLVRVNVIATMRLAHALIPAMKAKKSGGIISISSIAGFQPIPYMATYAGTKAFNLSHSMGLRYELRRFGIKVLTVCPGPVNTEFGGVARVPGEFSGSPRDPVEAVVRQSLAAYRKNRAVVVPGNRAKFLIWPVYVLPLALTTWFTERMMRRVLPFRKAS